MLTTFYIILLDFDSQSKETSLVSQIETLKAKKFLKMLYYVFLILKLTDKSGTHTPHVKWLLYCRVKTSMHDNLDEEVNKVMNGNDRDCPTLSLDFKISISRCA